MRMTGAVKGHDEKNNLLTAAHVTVSHYSTEYYSSTLVDYCR